MTVARAMAVLNDAAEVEDTPPWLLLDSGTDEPGLNLATATSNELGPGDLRVAAEWYASEDVPFCFLLREDVHSAAIQLLLQTGQEVALRSSAMLLRPIPARAEDASDLQITPVVDSRDLDDYVRLGADGYPPELARALAEAALASPRLRLHLARVGSNVVATALTSEAHALAGIFGVNVDPPMRHRGIATRVVAHVVEQGRIAGCDGVVVESMPEGRAFYERLGFVEEWRYVRIGCADPRALVESLRLLA